MFLVFQIASLICLAAGVRLQFTGHKFSTWVVVLSFAFNLASLYIWRSEIAFATAVLTGGSVFCAFLIPKRIFALCIAVSAVTVLTSVAAAYLILKEEQEAIQYVRKSLSDPDNAQFRNIRSTKWYFAKDIVCGEVNSKNVLGGYSGYEYFIYSQQHVLLASDRMNLEFESSDGNLTRSCIKNVYRMMGKEIPSLLK
ncbi:MAG: hypothetical protein WC100_20835 [Sterolibacterium sp.]